MNYRTLSPKEKALELYNNYDQLLRDFTRGVSIKEAAKQCALIAVDEILNTLEYSSQADEMSKVSYWNEVKKEIQQL